MICDLWSLSVEDRTSLLWSKSFARAHAFPLRISFDEISYRWLPERSHGIARIACRSQSIGVMISRLARDETKRRSMTENLYLPCKHVQCSTEIDRSLIRYLVTAFLRTLLGHWRPIAHAKLSIAELRGYTVETTIVEWESQSIGTWAMNSIVGWPANVTHLAKTYLSCEKS